MPHPSREALEVAKSWLWSTVQTVSSLKNRKPVTAVTLQREH